MRKRNKGNSRARLFSVVGYDGDAHTVEAAMVVATHAGIAIKRFRKMARNVTSIATFDVRAVSA